MSRNSSLTRHIEDFFEGLGQPCESSEILEVVVKRLLEASTNKRKLSSDALASIRKSFKDIPGGRRRAVHRGLEQCLLYLEQVCQWELPESKVPRYRDHKQQWMIKLFAHAQLGSAVHKHYQAQKVDWIHTRAPLCASEVILVLSMEVAPLPLSIWFDVLSNSSSIEKLDGQFTVRFDHPNQTLKSGELPSFTRYALTPFACRVLWNYYQTHSDQTLPSKGDGAKKRSPASLKREIKSTVEDWNAWIAPLSARYEFAPLIDALDPNASVPKRLKAANWHCIFQIIWHCAYGYPSELLRDHAVPAATWPLNRLSALQNKLKLVS
ncbi:putative orphan protein [Vibrio ishigakensis]|uniref:Putative orphan protein n=1 Tax=Vibrio ishigakensis TaxID=1481914 RepID=A0A0B8Q2V1_9VIBR|nr:putative orphan protein [Vibrio ishigakensis]